MTGVGRDGANRRVLHLCLSNAWGGQEMYVHSIAEALRARGLFVAVAARGGRELAVRAERAGIPLLSYRGGLDRLLFPFKVRSFIREHDVGVVHFQQLRSVRRVLPFLPRHGARPRYVFTDHSPRRRRVSSVFTSFVLGRLDAMVVTSRRQREIAACSLGLDQGRIRVLYNGVDVRRFAFCEDGGERRAMRRRFGIPDGVHCISTVGRVVRDKGQDVFLEAARRILSHRRDVRFEIVGETVNLVGGQRPFVDDIEAEAAAPPLRGSVHIRGFVEDMAAYYRAVDVVVVPSRVENFGLVAAEAIEPEDAPVVRLVNSIFSAGIASSASGKSNTSAVTETPMSMILLIWRMCMRELLRAAFMSHSSSMWSSGISCANSSCRAM